MGAPFWPASVISEAARHPPHPVEQARQLGVGESLLCDRQHVAVLPLGHVDDHLVRTNGLSLDNRIGRKESRLRQRRNERICKWE
jgi:hypothetical protein